MDVSGQVLKLRVSVSAWLVSFKQWMQVLADCCSPKPRKPFVAGVWKLYPEPPTVFTGHSLSQRHQSITEDKIKRIKKSEQSEKRKREGVHEESGLEGESRKMLFLQLRHVQTRPRLCGEMVFVPKTSSRSFQIEALSPGIGSGKGALALG